MVKIKAIRFTDTAQIVNDALDQDKKVLFEGAQGVMLDVSQGTLFHMLLPLTQSRGGVYGVGVGPNNQNSCWNLQGLLLRVLVCVLQLN